VLMAQLSVFPWPVFPATMRDVQLRHYRQHGLPPAFVL
jgi:hypothetical protein